MKRIVAWTLAAAMAVSIPSVASAAEPEVTAALAAEVGVVSANEEAVNAGEISSEPPAAANESSAVLLDEQRSTAAMLAAPVIGSAYKIVCPGAQDASDVTVACWSKLNGQDDLVWYPAVQGSDGSWVAAVDVARHGGGTMEAHAYADGHFVDGISFETPVPDEPGLLVIPREPCNYTILITNLPGPFRVQVPVWSAAGGQDDLAWYDARYLGGNTWAVEVNTANHGGGSMLCHLYVNGMFRGGTSFTAPEGQLTARTVLLGGTRYAVTISNLWGAKRVQVPTWGDQNGQDDIIWYEAEQSGPGTWTAAVNAANHDEGTIRSNVYADGQCLNLSARMRRSFTQITDEDGCTAGISAGTIASYSRTKVCYGHGGPKDSSGRFTGPIANQARYGHYDADFIAPESNRIYLTIDEGYEAGYTAQILDTLKAKNVKAVFFVTGGYVKEAPDLVRRMIAEGHTVGNHSVSHPSMPTVSDSRAFSEMTGLHKLVQKQFGYDMPLYRAPLGEFSERDLALAQALGYRSVFWSFAYVDWDPGRQSGAAAALKKVKQDLHPGAIYLLHAVSRDNAGMLGDFIDYARSQGYEFTEYDLH